MVRDAKVALDVNKTRQIAQEMVKVKRLNAASSEHFCSTHHVTKTSQVSPTVSSGNGLPPRKGDFTQGHEVQERVL